MGWLTELAFTIAKIVAGLSPGLARIVNRVAINRLVSATRNRPHPWSTLAEGVSWRGLTDRTYSARHLPAEDIPDLPLAEDVAQLFAVPEGQAQRLCPKSTCLFPAFAQYLTDGFIRTMISNDFKTGTSFEDRTRNTSNHEIDQCPLYGLNERQNRALRTNSEAEGQKGKLKSEFLGAEEFPLRLFLPGGMEFNPAFVDADGTLLLDTPLGITKTTPQMRETLFAVGGDRANAVPQVSMLNTLFLREHNRLADAIAAANRGWNDDQVFNAARASVTVIFIKIVVEEYINHINSTPLKLTAEPSAAWTAKWNRPNWISAEFSLLYRWHSLIPETMHWGEDAIESRVLRLNNAVLIDRGLATAFAQLSANPATELGLRNTASFLVDVEASAIGQARQNRIAPFVRYQRAFGEKPAQHFGDITPDNGLRKALSDVYGTADRLEFYVGLFAQPRTKNGPLPPLLQTMVAVDAFSQALTNPLLSQHIWDNAEVRLATFTRQGLDAIEATTSLRDILVRNASGLGNRFVGMTRQDWKRA